MYVHASRGGTGTEVGKLGRFRQGDERGREACRTRISKKIGGTRLM